MHHTFVRIPSSLLHWFFSCVCASFLVRLLFFLKVILISVLKYYFVKSLGREVKCNDEHEMHHKIPMDNPYYMNDFVER